MSLERPDTLRQYTCLACEDTRTGFQTKCPSCGGTAFRTNPRSGNEPPSALGIVAEATAPVNPYIPR